MTDPVCPLCVQWRCSVCKSQDYPFCCDAAPMVSTGPGPDAQAEPFWASGQIAVLTQQEICSECAQMMHDYYEDRKDDPT